MTRLRRRRFYEVSGRMRFVVSHLSRKDKDAARVGPRRVSVSHPSRRDKTRRGWGTRRVSVSHPSRRDKNAARMGHPASLGIPPYPQRQKRG